MSRGRKAQYFFGPYYDCMWTIRDIQVITGLAPNTILQRILNNGGKLEKKIFNPNRIKTKHFITDKDGEYMTLANFARKHDLDYRLVYNRYVYSGVRDTEVFKQPAFLLDKHGTCQTSKTD